MPQPDTTKRFSIFRNGKQLGSDSRGASKGRKETSKHMVLFRPKGNRLFPPVGQYADDLKTTWRSLAIPDQPSSHEASTVVRKETADFTWADLFTLERAVLAAEPDVLLRRHAWVIRCRYRSVAGDQEFQVYLSTHPPESDSAPADTLRADLEVLLARTQYLLLFQPSRERLRSALTSVGYGLIVVALIATTFPARYFSIGTMYAVFFMGWVGGNLSAIQRIQSLPEGDPIFRMSLVYSSWFSLIFSSITGGAFAFILYLIFVAGILQGSFFPSIVGSGDYLHFWDYAMKNNIMLPESDWAKLLIWSFIAGFAERLVPDLLTRLAAATKSSAT